MKLTRKIASLIILAAMLLSAAVVPALAALPNGEGGYVWNKVSNSATRQLKASSLQFEGKAQDYFKTNDTVRVSILMEEPSTMDLFGYKSSKTIASNKSALAYRGRLLDKQNRVTADIEAALGGKKLDVVWNLTLAANIISANVRFGEIDKIAEVPGVKAVYVENVYTLDPVERGDSPNQSVGTSMTKTDYAWAEGYTGAGSIVAIVDTGLDVTHELFDPDAFMYAIEEDREAGKEFELLDQDKLAEALPNLNLSSRGDYSAEDLYLNPKIPLAFNYSENNLVVGHMNDTQSEHGTHVTSIAAANRYVKDENGDFVQSLDSVLTQGQAPDAQVIVIKYFSARTGTDADYFAAIEDCIFLGVDSVNLSLGSSQVSGLAINRVYEKILKKIEESDLMMVCSSGNNGSWSGHLGIFQYLYADDKNQSTGGSPGTYPTSFTVGSADNDGSVGAYISYLDYPMFYSESPYKNQPLRTLVGTYDFVYLDSVGTDEEFAAIADAISGKIALCNRGTTSFYQKADAAVANGAIAVVIVNNTAGVINMNLADYHYTAPVVSILQSDGEFIKNTAEAVKDGDKVLYYTGQFELTDKLGVGNYYSDYYTMSSFSSWGTPGNLIMKPDIVTPGGGIYAANGAHKEPTGSFAGGSDQYELMSGTSMAAPQVTGIVATVAQYVRENNLTEKTGLTQRQLIQSLLMSTATPMLEGGETYYPIMQQGAGFADVAAAVAAGSYIWMGDDATKYADDGRIKAEIGAITEPEFSFSFSVNNFSDEDKMFLLSADFFTQDLFMYYTYDAGGNSTGYAVYNDTATWFLNADVTWKVNGEEFDPAGNLIYDFDGDGKATYSDAAVLLEYAVGNLEEFPNMEYADLNEDGEIDSYDAYLALDVIAEAGLTVPAGEKADIEINVALLDIDDYDFSGAYIEGFVYAEEMDTEDGVLGVTHSIPVFGFYGDWTESSMFDHGGALNYFCELGDLPPYMLQVDGAVADIYKAWLVKYPGDDVAYEFTGNPYLSDVDENGDYAYFENRDALNSSTVLDTVRYTQLRNAVAGRIQVVNQNGDILFENMLGAQYAAHYSDSSQQWYRTYTEMDVGYKPGDDVEEGDYLTAMITLAPEYYANEEGEIDWDALGEGATYAFSFTIDNTAPEISEIDMHYDTRKGGFDRLDITAQDNQYISAVYVTTESGIEYASYGSDPSAEAEAGAVKNYSLDFTGLVEDGTIDSLADIEKHILIEVYDYAGNRSTYKINLNPDELQETPELTISEENIRLHKGNTLKLYAEVTPWGVDDTVIWTSSDDDVATVDEYGVVTAVGEGNAIITATSAVDDKCFAECDVEVFVIDNTIMGALQDEEGTPLLFSWNLKDDDSWRPLSEFPVGFTAMTMNQLDGNIYVQDWDGYIGIIDGQTGEILDVSEGTSAFGAPMYSIAFPNYNNAVNGTNMAFGIYGGYLLFSEDIMDNTFNRGYQLGTYLRQRRASSFVALAWGGYDPTSGSDILIAIDNVGGVWQFLYSADGLNFGYIKTNYKNGFVQYKTEDKDYYLSSVVIGQDGEVYLSAFDGKRIDIYQLPFILDGTTGEGYMDCVHIGNAGADVWPVSLLSVVSNSQPEPEPGQGGGGNSLYVPFAAESAFESIGVLGEASAQRFPAAASRNLLKEAVPLRAADKKNAVRGPVAANTINAEMLLFTVIPDEAVTNGIIEVEYDPELLELAIGAMSADYSASNIGDGKATFAFANHDAAEPEDASLLLGFFQDEGLTNANYTEVKVTYKQLNDEYPETEEIFTFGKPPVHTHVFDEPEWTWSEDYSLATVTLTCTECEESVTLPAKVTSEVTDATYEADGKIVYTATAVFGIISYTETATVVLPALVYTYGEITIVWAEDNTATAYVLRNDGEKINVETNVDSQTTAATHTTAGYTVYTATATFGDETATDSRIVEIPAAGHTYGEPEWTWSEDLTMAIATFSCDCEEDGSVITLPAEVTSTLSEGVKNATATVQFNGKDYSNSASVDVKTERVVHIIIDSACGTDPSQVSIYFASEGKAVLSELTEIVEEPDFVLGDINDNGAVDANDFMLAKRYVLRSVELTQDQINRGDVNRDGKLNSSDYIMIRRYLLRTFDLPENEPTIIPGPSFDDCILIFVGADGKVISVDSEAGKAKNDAAVPEGGFIISAPYELAKDGIEGLEAGTEIKLVNVDAEACANAACDTLLEDAEANFSVIVIPND